MEGKVWRTPHIVIEQVDPPVGTRLRGHVHPVAQLSFLERGVVTSRERGRSRWIESGTLRSSPAGDELDLSFQEPSRCLVILLEDDPCEISPRLARERHFLRSERACELARQLSAMLSSECPASGLEIEALVLELSAEVFLSGQSTRMSAPQPWLTRIRDRLRSEPEAPPSTSELAADVGYHPVYVARAFRQCYGMGLGEYSRLVRAEYALGMLATSNRSLAEVALIAGYSDQSHLTRAMRRLVRATPATLRRQGGRTVEVATVQERELPAS